VATRFPRGSAGGPAWNTAGSVVDDVVVAVASDPVGTYLLVDAAGTLLRGAAEVAVNVGPDVVSGAAGAAEAVGSLAQAAFEAIIEIISSLTS